MRNLYIMCFQKNDNTLPHTAKAINIAQPNRLYHKFIHFSRNLKNMYNATVTADIAMIAAPIM
jgi:hypothetical protein